MTHDDCIFCKIITKEITTPGVIYEDDHYMAFLSIFPSTEGFTVVIPKDHYGSDVMALPDDILQSFILTAKKVSHMLETAFPDVGRVGVMMEGTGINHAHIKLFPMHNTPELKNGGFKPIHSDQSFWFESYEGWFPSSDGPAQSEQEISKIAHIIVQANS